VIDERIAERRKQVREERRRGRLRRTITVAVLVVLVLVLVVVERSALVALEEVRVAGTERLDESDVLEAAGLELGSSTLRLNLRGAAGRVEDLALVRTASARRLDPLTVLIEVEERVPVLVAESRRGAVLVDREGVVFDEAGDEEGLPVVVVADRLPAVGDGVEVSPGLANAHEVWRGLSGPLRVEVVRYEATGPDELTLVLDDGVEVRFGRAERIDEKVRALGAVLEDLAATDVAEIDVRAPSAPVVVGR